MHPCNRVPTGASYKRDEEGIVLVNSETCIGCKLCSWACPYGAREYDETAGVMKKCTLCVDKIYNENLPEEERVPACVSSCPTGARSFGDLGDKNSDIVKIVNEREGYDLMPEQDCKPVNKYLPPKLDRNNFKNTELDSITKDKDLIFEENGLKRLKVLPSKSIIFFTVISGTGYGVFFGLLYNLIVIEISYSLEYKLILYLVSFIMIISGLLSSTFHLGHPERAWRAISQWKTSWLSREGLAAIVTFVPCFYFIFLDFESDLYFFLNLNMYFSLITIFCMVRCMQL